jgi:hypothetical protein
MRLYQARVHGAKQHLTTEGTETAEKIAGAGAGKEYGSRISILMVLVGGCSP